MSIVPAEMSVSVGLEALRLLDKLSKIVGVESCRRCYYPQDACSCQHSTTGNVAIQDTQAQASSAVYSTASSVGQFTQLATKAAPVPGAGLLGAPPGLPPPNLRTWSDVAAYWNPSDAEFPALGGYKASVDLDTPFIPQVTLPPRKAPVKAPSTESAAPGDTSGTTPGQAQPMDTTPAPLKQQGPPRAIRQSAQRTQQQQKKSTLRGMSRGALPIRGAFRALRHQQDEEEALLPLLNRRVPLEHRDLKTGLGLRKDSEGEEEVSSAGPPLPAIEAGLQESAEEGADPGNEALSLQIDKGVL